MAARRLMFLSMIGIVVSTLIVLAAVRVGHALPRGEELVYSSVTSWNTGINATIYRMDVDRMLSQLLFNSRTDNLPGLPVIWSPDGEQVAYVQSDQILETYLADASGGSARRLGYSTDYEYNTLWSPDGRWLAFIGGGDGGEDIYLADADGSQPRNLTQTGLGYRNLSWSPDSRRLVAEGQNPEELFVIQLADGQITRLTNDHAKDIRPFWSPDGQWIAFMSSRESGGFAGTRFDLYVLDAACIDSPAGCDDVARRLTEHFPADSAWQPFWSPDSGRILFASISWMGGSDLYLVDVTTGAAQNLTNDNARESSPDWSPDGRSLIFESNKGGIWAVYRMETDGTGRVRLTDGTYDSRRPLWSPDGQRVLYIANPSRNWDLYLMTFDEQGDYRLTDNWEIDFYPMWRPASK